MKKIIKLLILIIFLIPINVKADHMYSVDMYINILKDGQADITEKWDVQATSGTEWYKTMYELNGSELSNFVVYKDGVELTYKPNWNVNDSLYQKSNYYGINNTSDGPELCFGKGDMNRHQFVLKYTLSNYIFNTNDSQVLYWTLMPKVTVDYFSVSVTSYYNFPDTLAVWGYGNKGYVYVKNGKISMSEETGLNNDKVVLLARFPLGTFNTGFRLKEFKNFDEVLKSANKGSFKYDYSSSNKIDIYEVFEIIKQVVFVMIFGLGVAILFFGSKLITDYKYGYVNNKVIDKETIPMFRDIPCNKNIYYANILIKLNGFDYNKFNIIGAIILKWVKNNQIILKKEKTGTFNKETSIIVLKHDNLFENNVEKELHDMMFKASRDGELNAWELQNWAESNYDIFLKLFDTIEEDEINRLKLAGHIYNRIYKNECKAKIVLDDTIYNDSQELYGLKKFLDEFSRIDTKEIMEVHLWDEYLMFAYLFGIADKVTKQLKNIYPEIMEQSQIDENVIDFLDNIVDKSVDRAKSARNIDKQRELMRERARKSARSYSSGGGGYSRGGGGNTSRGGGSRGSMGGR